MPLNTSRFLTAFCTLFFLTSSMGFAYGADWAEKMFKDKKHDFGTVSRNAKSEFAFIIENCYEEDVHIVSVRSSCGCTKPVLTKNTLKSWEKGEVVAQFNTKSFLGSRSAAITVVIDKPYYAEVTLNVTGKIRSDIVVEPGEIQFGDVDVKSTKTQDIRISYAGRRDWTITDVRGNVDFLEVKMDPASRQGSQTNYTMHVRIKDNAPVGDVQEEITIVTNDATDSQFTLPVQARIIPPVSVSPKFLSIGDLKKGTQFQQKILVRGKAPFAIAGVDCDDKRFTFQLPTGEKTIHVIPVTVQGEAVSDEEKSIKQSIKIRTSLGEALDVEVLAAGRIVE